MICKNCGNENPKGAKYCGRCGWEQSSENGTCNRIVQIIKSLLISAGVMFIILLLVGILTEPSVEDVENEIDSIGTVTINSEKKLLKIVELCDSLSAEEQNQIRNIDLLIEASEEFARQAELLTDAMNAINELGTITLDSKRAVAAAREKYDMAAVYDLNGVMKEHEVVLETAESELVALIKEQEQSLEFALSSIGNVTSHFFTGDYSWGESSFQTQIDKIQNNNDRQQYAGAVMEQICKWAQTKYDKGSYVETVAVLQNSDTVKEQCSEEMSAGVDQLKEKIIQELNSQAPKNGKMLARTYIKGANSFTITVGTADTIVKLESVDNPEEYAMIYIKANEKATINNIIDGEYRIKYTTGPVWYGEEEMFGPDATYILWDETIKPKANNMGSYATWTKYTWEIEYGYGSDYGAQNMDPRDF